MSWTEQTETDWLVHGDDGFVTIIPKIGGRSIYPVRSSSRNGEETTGRLSREKTTDFVLTNVAQCSKVKLSGSRCR